jgi:hypothetical protein
LYNFWCQQAKDRESLQVSTESSATV